MILGVLCMCALGVHVHCVYIRMCVCTYVCICALRVYVHVYLQAVYMCVKYSTVEGDVLCA